MTFAIGSSTRGSATVFSIRGDIDLNTAPLLLEALDTLGGRAAEPVILDLSEVAFLDSSALGALVGAEKQISHAGGRLTVVCSDPKVLRIFTITRLTEVIDVVDTLDAAAPPQTD
jgi:anti-sigma B factor antagonist